MADVVTLLQGRIIFLEQENAYLKDLLERWLTFYTIHIGQRCQLPVKQEKKLFSLIKEKEK